MAEYEIHFSKARALRGLKGWCVMRLEVRDSAGDFWKAVSEHKTETEAEDALHDLQETDAFNAAEARFQDGR